MNISDPIAALLGPWSSQICLGSILLRIALSMLSVILGILVIMSPFAMANIAMSVGGIALIYTGLVHIAQGIKMPKQEG